MDEVTSAKQRPGMREVGREDRKTSISFLVRAKRQSEHVLIPKGHIIRTPSTPRSFSHGENDVMDEWDESGFLQN
jgi:hypothetical protein